MIKSYIWATNHVADLKRRIADDDDGAALVEYSVLIGLITVAAVLSIGAVGTWVAAKWLALKNAIGA